MNVIQKGLTYVVAGFGLVCLVSILLFATAASFLNAEVFNSFEVRSVLIICWISLVSVSILSLRRLFKRKQVLKAERLESLSEGATEEPRIYRELSSEESNWLHKRHKGSYWVISNYWWLIPFILIVDGLFIIWIWNSPSAEFTSDVILGVFAIPFLLQLLLATLAGKELPLYQDLRSPVFKVQGKIFDKDSRQYINKFTVKNILFEVEEGSENWEVYKKLKDYDEVVIEYSPHTKHVWKIYKTEDI